MAKKYTAAELLTVVRNSGMIPDTGSTGSTDTDLLQWINDGITLYLLPRLIKVREDYFVQRSREALGSANSYRIPHRAAYNKLKNLWYTDSGGTREKLTFIPESFRAIYSGTRSGAPAGYFAEGDYVFLLPEGEGSFAGYLEYVFFMRPSQLVEVTSAGVVASVLGKVITCTADVTSLFSTGDTIDVHSAYSGSELKEWDLTVTDVTTTNITVSESIDGSVFGRRGVAAGDYVCAAEECAIPTLPREFHPVVARAAAMAWAESIGDGDGVKLHGALLGEQLQEAIIVLENRVEQNPIRLGTRGWV
jgi:hypothetical protein